MLLHFSFSTSNTADMVCLRKLQAGASLLRAHLASIVPCKKFNCMCNCSLQPDASGSTFVPSIP